MLSVDTQLRQLRVWSTFTNPTRLPLHQFLLPNLAAISSFPVFFSSFADFAFCCYFPTTLFPFVITFAQAPNDRRASEQPSPSAPGRAAQEGERKLPAAAAAAATAKDPEPQA